MRQEGQSTEEFDRNLAASVRRYLKTKGLSDADIERQLAKTQPPINTFP